jgi:hypothetical protein
MHNILFIYTAPFLFPNCPSLLTSCQIVTHQTVICPASSLPCVQTSWCLTNYLSGLTDHVGLTLWRGFVRYPGSYICIRAQRAPCHSANMITNMITVLINRVRIIFPLHTSTLLNRSSSCVEALTLHHHQSNHRHHHHKQQQQQWQRHNHQQHHHFHQQQQQHHHIHLRYYNHHHHR